LVLEPFKISFTLRRFAISMKTNTGVWVVATVSTSTFSERVILRKRH
jgi:hypothetical protein